MEGSTVAPVKGCSLAQLAYLFTTEGKDGAGLKKLTVEAPDSCCNGVREFARIHSFPKLAHDRLEYGYVLLAAFEDLSEGILRQEPNIFGEHREETAHEEEGDLFRRVLLVFQGLGNGGKALGNGSCYARRRARRVQC
jgi:hypothetical protein